MMSNETACRTMPRSVARHAGDSLGIGTPAERAARRGAAAFAALLQLVQHWHGRRQTRARLALLSERQLRDVGLPSPPAGSPMTALWEQPHLRPDIR